MGACIDTTLKKKKTNTMTTTMKKRPSALQTNKKAKQPPKFKQMSTEQLLYQYLIQDLVPQACNLEGPKYISNRVTGQIKVLRIFQNQRKLSYDGLINFKNLSNSQLFKFDGDYYLMISQLLTGSSVFEYFVNRPQSDCSEALKTIYSMICSMHDTKIYHGALTFDSFRFVSKNSKQIVLSQLNYSEGQDYFGSLHINSQAADWEFFGILLYTLTQGKLPYFSKQINQYRGITNPSIQDLLKGRPTVIQWNTLKTANNLNKVLVPYRFRQLLYKLIKLKNKRKRLDFDLYDSVTVLNMNTARPMQDQMNKYEKNMIINRIKNILPSLNDKMREQYLKLTIGGQKLNQYQGIFILHPDKMYQELTYKLSNSLN